MVSTSETQVEYFECGQDVTLILSAFISAHKRINTSSDERSFSLQGLTDEQLHIVGEVVSSSLEFITQKLEGRVYRKEEKCKYSKTQRRIHAVVLYHVLNSYGICCKEASKYFESVEGTFPKIDWKTYFHLQKICLWNLLFFDQMIQLNPSVLAVVFRQIFQEIYFTKDSLLYVLNSVLQVLLDQLFTEIPASRKPSKSVINFSFPFQLSSCGTIHTSCDSKDSLSNSSRHVMSESEDVLLLLSILEKRVLDLDIVRTVLRGLNTLLDKIIKCTPLPKSLVSRDAVEVYLQFSKHFFSSENTKSLVHNVFKTFKIDSNVVISNPDEHVVTHIFLLFSKLDYLMSLLAADSKNSTGKPSWLDDLCDNLNEIPVYLPSFPLSSSDETAIDKEEFIKLAIHLSGSRDRIRLYAYKLLVMSSEFLARQDVISCVEKQWERCISNAAVVIIMMESVLKMQGTKRNSMIEVFVAIYNYLSMEMKKIVLKEFISRHGLSEYFKLPYFETDFKSSNKNATPEQATKYILCLCLQSPKKALQRLLDKQFTHGHMKTVLQAFKEVDFICSYKESSDSLPLLIKILQPHFCSQTFVGKQADNALTIIRSLLETFNDNDEAFPVNVFIQICIFTYLRADDASGNCIFLLTLLDVISTHSIETKNVKWVSKFVAPPVIVLLCQIISAHLIGYKGFSKAIAIKTLNSFIQAYNKLLEPKKLCLSEEDKKWIKFRLQKSHPYVLFYIQDLIYLSKSDVAFIDLQSIVFWYAVHENKDVHLLEKHIEANYAFTSRPALLLDIARIMPHLTADEMLRLCKSLCGVDLAFFQQSKENYDIPTDERKALEVITLMVDCFVMLTQAKCITMDWAYMLSSFGQVVKVICDSVFCTLTFSHMFIQLCRLIGKIAEGTDTIDVMLQRVLGKLKSEKETYRNLSSIMYGLQ